jgi:hypothetical protein
MSALTDEGGPYVTVGVTVSAIAVKVTQREYSVTREFRLFIKCSNMVVRWYKGCV